MMSSTKRGENKSLPFVHWFLSPEIAESAELCFTDTLEQLIADGAIPRLLFFRRVSFAVRLIFAHVLGILCDKFYEYCQYCILSQIEDFILSSSGRHYDHVQALSTTSRLLSLTFCALILSPLFVDSRNFYEDNFCARTYGIAIGSIAILGLAFFLRNGFFLLKKIRARQLCLTGRSFGMTRLAQLTVDASSYAFIPTLSITLFIILICYNSVQYCYVHTDGWMLSLNHFCDYWERREIFFIAVYLLISNPIFYTLLCFSVFDFGWRFYVNRVYRSRHPQRADELWIYYNERRSYSCKWSRPARDSFN